MLGFSVDFTNKSYKQRERELITIIDFKLNRIWLDHSQAGQDELKFLKKTIVTLELEILRVTHGEELKGIKLKNFEEKISQLMVYMRKNPTVFLISNDEPYLMITTELGERYLKLSQHVGELIDWVIETSYASFKNGISWRSKLVAFLTELKFDIGEYDQRTQKYQVLFDQVFVNNSSVKVLYLDFGYKTEQLGSGIDWEVMENHFAYYQEKVAENFPNLVLQLRKLEFDYSTNLNKYSYIAVFDQAESLQPNTLAKRLEKKWKESFTHLEGQGKGIEPIAEFLNPELISCGFTIGVVTKDSRRYKNFISTVLNYYVNGHYYLKTIQANTGQHLDAIGCTIRDKVDKDQNKKVNQRKSRPILHRDVMIKSQYDWERSLRLSKPLIKQKKDIKLLYSLLLDRDDTKENDLKELLYKIDLMVLCALKWKIPAFVVSDGSSAVKSGTEIGKVIVEIDKVYKSKRQELIQKAEYLGLRVGLFVFIFEYLEISAVTPGLISSGLNRYHLYNTLVDEINLVYLKPINELVPYLRKRIDEIIAKRSASFGMLGQDESEPEFLSILQKKLTILLEQKINRPAKSDLTLKDWYSTQIRSRQNSYENLVRYSRQCRSDQTKDILVDIEFTLSNDSELDINFFHEVLTKGIDLLSRTDFAKEAIRGYWGAWQSVSSQNQQCKAHVSLMFFMDQRYVARKEELRDELSKALEKAVASPYKNWDKSNELKFNFKEYLWFQAFGEEVFSDPVSDRKKIEKELERRLHQAFYLALHRDLYWLPSELILKQRVIRGREGYKPRRKSSKPKALK